MKHIQFIFLTATALCAALRAPAATHYVDLNSPNPTPPYTNWVTAATNIQDAVDAAAAGDDVLVTNGIYSTGGRAAGTNAQLNRVAIDRAISVQSVNGRDFSIIQGGAGFAARGVYLADGASLNGFTVQNGGAQYAGGVFSESQAAVVNNCLIVSNSAYGGGGAYGGTLNNCTLLNNTAFGSSGGGALFCTLSNCLLTGNSAPAQQGGGAFGGSLMNCIVVSNSASGGGGAASNILTGCVLIGNSIYPGTVNGIGGGIFGCSASNCIIESSSANSGGGAFGSSLVNCVINKNTCSDYGGGVYSCTLSNCTLSGNSAAGGYGVGGGGAIVNLYNCKVVGNSGLHGGGVSFASYLFNSEVLSNTAGDVGGGGQGSTLINCTIVGNAATNSGGGTSGCNLGNCIFYLNSASSNANYDGGGSSFTNDPSFIDLHGGNLRLQTNSPCINAGNNALVYGATDLDGRPRIVGGTVDLGAYEFQGPGLGEFTGWLQQYGLPTDGSADYADSDGDGMNNWQEWIAGTNPTNAASVLRMLSARPAATNVVVTWSSVNTRVYSLARATNLATASLAFSIVRSNITGLAGTTSLADTNPPAGVPAFYRVMVRLP